MLVCLRVDIGWSRSRAAAVVRVSEKLEPCLDVRVAWIQFSSPLVRVEGIVDLVVTTLVQSAEVIPDLGDKWVKANSPRVGVQSISVLVDLVVEHTNGAPEGGIASITVDSLLVRLVSLRILGL